MAPHRKAWLFVAVLAACSEDFRSERVLTDDPVVMGISLSVVEDGRYAGVLGPLPSDRRRAEVLPDDTIELDALVANVEGVVPLDDAAWVLCGGLEEGCLGSLRQQGERGGLEACREDSVARSSACLAGRGERPQLVMPAFAVDPLAPSYDSLRLFWRVGVIVGRAGGPTTDECLQQLVHGPRVDLWGCGIGVRDVPYGPDWRLNEVLRELGLPVEDEALPALVAQFWPPNAAVQIEHVLVGEVVGDLEGNLARAPGSEPRSIDDVVELEVDAKVFIEPVVSARDQQLILRLIGPDAWIGRSEGMSFDVWSDREDGADHGAFQHGNYVTLMLLQMPPDPGPMHLYFTVTDGREGISWFTLDLQVVAR